MASWYSEYRCSLKAVEIEEFLDLVFYRPLAFVVVKLVLHTPITPNQLTYTALLFGVMAGICLSFGTEKAFFFGGIAYMISNVFDCSDGQLARLKGNGTLTGRIIDGVADYLSGIAVYLGIYFGYLAQRENAAIWSILLALAGLSNILHATIVDFYRQRFVRFGFGEKNVTGNADQLFRDELTRLRNINGSRIELAILRIYLWYSTVQNKLTRTNCQETSSCQQFTPSVYYRHNHLIMKFWTLLGPTTQITFLVITALIYRPDIYILGMLGAFNLLAITLYLVQQVIDIRLEKALKHD